MLVQVCQHLSCARKYLLFLLGHVYSMRMNENDLFPQTASEAAKAMSALGASKGGKARANTMTPEERSEVARNAVRARWAKAGKLKESKPAEKETVAAVSQPTTPLVETESLPFSMFPGNLRIGDMD